MVLICPTHPQAGDKETERDRETKRQRDRETERQRDRQRHTETKTERGETKKTAADVSTVEESKFLNRHENSSFLSFSRRSE